MLKKSAAGSILAVLALANVVGYAARNALFTVYPDLRAQLGLTDDQIGLLATAFIVPHALATLPFGWLGDNYDRRRVIAVGLVIASLASAAGALAHTTHELLASRAFVGLGMAAIVPVANSILAQIFEGPAKASRVSIFNLGVLFGAVSGMTAGLVFGFPNVVIALAVPGIALAVAILALPVPPHPGEALPSGSLSFRRARELFEIKTLRWIIGSTIAMAFAAGGYNAWLVDFLERDKGMTPGQATWLLSVSGVGAVAGILTGGRIADRLRRRNVAGRMVTIAIGMICTLPCAILCVTLPNGPGLYVAGVAVMFFISWYHAPMAVSVDDIAPPERSVAAQGLVIFAMHLLGTAPSSYVIGVVSQHSTLYTAMWVPTGGLVVAIACALRAATTFPRDAIKR